MGRTERGGERLPCRAARRQRRGAPQREGHLVRVRVGVRVRVRLRVRVRVGVRLGTRGR